jgi:hypothetical protein
VTAQHDLLQSRNREMRFTHATRTHQQQTGLSVFANRRKFLGKSLHDELRLRETSIKRGQLIGRNVFNVVIRFEIIEIAVAIAFGNARSGESALSLVAFSAIAGDRPN